MYDHDENHNGENALTMFGLRKASWSQNQLLDRPRTVQVMQREEESFKMRWRIRFTVSHLVLVFSYLPEFTPALRTSLVELLADDDDMIRRGSFSCLG